MALIQPLALALMAVGLVPLLLHLLVRRRGRRTQFPSLRFLRASPARRLAPGRLNEPLLLAARLLLIALLALMVARPYGSSPAGAVGRPFRVVVLDVSASMQTGDLMAQAHQTAHSALAELEPTARAALVSYAGSARVLSGWAEPAQALRALEASTGSTQRSAAGSAHGAAVLEALELLQGVPGRAEVVWVSDFRGGEFESLRRRAVESGVHWISRPLGGESRSNDAPAAVRIDEDGDRLRVWVDRFSSEGSLGEEVSWTLGPERRQQLSGTLADGRALHARVTPEEVRVALEPGDAMAADDAVSFSLAVPEVVRVAVMGPEAELVLKALASIRQVEGLQVEPVSRVEAADLLVVTDLATAGAAVKRQADEALRRGAAVILGGAVRWQGEHHRLLPGPLMPDGWTAGAALDAVALPDPGAAGQVLARFEDGSAAAILQPDHGVELSLGFPLVAGPRGPGLEAWFPGWMRSLVLAVRPQAAVVQAARPPAARRESALEAPQIPGKDAVQQAAWVDPVAQERETGWALPLAWALLAAALMEGLLSRRAGGRT
jgi:hypothetical protein